MGVLSPLQRTLKSRCLVYYRAEPDVIARLLPDGVEPAVYRDHTLVGLCWTRCAGLPTRNLGPTWDELAFCFSVWSGDPSGLEHRVWVSRRETSSRFSAQWVSRVVRGEYELAEFEVSETPSRIRLRVEHDGTEELRLAAESHGELVGSVFLSTREVEEYLQKSGEIEPRNPLIPEAPDLSAAGGSWTIDPLSVYELCCPYFEDAERFPAGSLKLDSAFRWVRLHGEREHERDVADVALRSTAPYMPI
jgi:hypothetical protein